MAGVFVPDIWREITKYLDIVSLLRLMQTCKYIHTNLSVYHMDYGRRQTTNMLTQRKYATLSQLKISMMCFNTIYTPLPNLVSLNIIDRGACLDTRLVSNLTALTMISYVRQHLVGLVNLRRLELDDDIYAKDFRSLTKLTYLKFVYHVGVYNYARLPLLELDVVYCNFDLSPLTRLTKLHLTAAPNLGSINMNKLTLVELSIIRSGSSGHIDINNMTTLTSLTLIDSYVHDNGLRLRNLCICRCHACDERKVDQCSYVSCLKFSK
jgi:hypothetical protein